MCVFLNISSEFWRNSSPDRPVTAQVLTGREAVEGLSLFGDDEEAPAPAPEPAPVVEGPPDGADDAAFAAPRLGPANVEALKQQEAPDRTGTNNARCLQYAFLRGAERACS